MFGNDDKSHCLVTALIIFGHLLDFNAAVSVCTAYQKLRHSFRSFDARQSVSLSVCLSVNTFVIDLELIFFVRDSCTRALPQVLIFTFWTKNSIQLRIQ